MSIPSSSSSTSLPQFPSLPGLPPCLDETFAGRKLPAVRLPATRRRAAVRPRRDGVALARAAGLVVALGAVLAIALASWRLRSRQPALPDRSAEQVLALVEQRYRTVEHVMADVRLQVRHRTLDRALDRTLTREGRLYLQRGGKLRWDAFAPSLPPLAKEEERRINRSLVSDGEQLHLIDFGAREVVKLHRPDDPIVLATSALFAPSLAARFTVRFVPLDRYGSPDSEGRAGDEGDDDGSDDGSSDGDAVYSIELTPRLPDPRLEHLVFLVDSRMMVRQLVLETSHNRYRFAFSLQDLHTPPKERWFEVALDAPALAGFRLVDAEL
jgi:outer membrane lipoprotein-sorting protein